MTKSPNRTRAGCRRSLLPFPSAPRWPLCIAALLVPAAAVAQQVTLLSAASQQYVTVSAAGAVNASADTVGKASTFERLYPGDGFFALRDVKTGNFLTVQNTGKFAVTAGASAIAAAQEFTAVAQSDGSTALQARVNNQYVTVNTANGDGLAANATTAATGQSFTLTAVNADEAIVGTLAPAQKAQTIVGFGGAEAFYNNYLTANPYNQEIYQALFDPVEGLGITLLRLQDVYKVNSTATTNFDPYDQSIVEGASSFIGQAPTILMSAWSPPAYLKSNNNTTGGTLKKVDGAYDYAGYATWWKNSITAYRELGIDPAYVSIQNEPDAVVGYISNSFNPSEKPYNGNQYAGYNKALDAVYSAFQDLSDSPELIGPETQGIGYDTFQDFVDALNPHELGAIAEHLYGGGSIATPDSYDADMAEVDEQFPKKPKFDTEFYAGPAFNYAWLMHNALVAEQVSAYLYWGLAWPNSGPTDPEGLIYLDNPYNAPSTWQDPHGWALTDQYYAFKHFSYFIRPGYHRVDTTVNDPDIRLSAYLGPKGRVAVAVILNTSSTRTISFALAGGGLAITNSHVYRSTFSNSSTERWANIGELGTGNTVSLPPQSIATVALNE